MNYIPGDLVDVKSAVATWRPGVVSIVDEKRIVVDLDAPLPTANQWSGETRRYGGGQPVSNVTIWKASEAIGDGGGGACCHIRMRP